jgi:asparagine synthase (glutamine-hydrolysing)
MEEPVFEPPGISLYYVSKMAKEHVKVLISGEGGDEAFAGYQTYRNLVWLERIKKMLGPAKSAIAGLANETNGPSSINKIDKYAPIMDLPIEQYYYSRASSPANLFNRYWKQIYNRKHVDNLSLFSQDNPFNQYLKNVNIGSDLKKMLYIDTKTWLPDRLLIKADKMTMANSIELRVPLLDHKVLEFAASLPDRQKLRGVTTKHIFKSIFKNEIPNTILKKKKTGFLTPYASWLHKNRDQVLSILLDKQTMQRGYFDYDAINLRLIKPWEKDRRYSAEIFQLMVLELWHRIFLENGSPQSVLPKFN